MLKINLILVLLCSATHAATAISPAAAQIERKVIERTAFAGTDEELQLVLATFPIGAASPPHIHPVVGLNYIVEGEVDSQYEGEPLKHFKAGDSYQDMANKKHLVFKNTGATPLRFIIAFKIKRGLAFKTDL